VIAGTYTRYELVRTFRNRRFLILSLGFPLVLYFLIAEPNRNVKNLGGSGIPAPLYLMVGLVAFGAMSAVLSSGARITVERSVGWTRQLRLTPLSPRAYFATKVVTAYAMAVTTMIVMYAAGTSLGVRLPARSWLEMSALVLVGLVPFAALGLLFGHILASDAVSPTIGGTTALLSVLGGVWFPIGNGSSLHTLAQALPSFWLVQASHVATHGHAWGIRGWLVMAAWSVIFSRLAVRAYKRDLARASTTN
jgi:ABC-2 type transport system permease protein